MMLKITFSIMFIMGIFTHSYALSLFKGLKATRVTDGQLVDFGESITSKAQSNDGKTLVVLGTYAADFNAIEYGQRLRHYLPQLKEKGVENFLMVLNASPKAAESFAKLLELPNEVELYCDQFGDIGKKYGVNLGWRPEDKDMNPYVKLFGMLWGLGAWMTLPSVISGYIGNPWTKQPWIESALAQGQAVGRWPNTALEIEKLTTTNGNTEVKIKTNKFNELPYVGGWGRRPLELATLRLQNMIGVSLNNWDTLKPTEEELNAGVLTQLGACFILNNKDSSLIYEWKDQGICHVANFEDMLKKL